MLDNGRISSIQLTMLLAMVEAPTAVLLVPSLIAEQAGPDAWISVLVPMSLYGLAVALVCIALARRFPFQVFTEYLPKVIGWFPGKLLALAYSLVFIHITSLILAECSRFIGTAFLRETPNLPIYLVILSAVIYGTYLGIEVIARQNELVFPAFLFSILMTIILVANNIDLNNLRPVLAKGVMPIIKGSYSAAIWRGEVFLLLMLFPYLNQKNEAFNSAVSMILIMMSAGTLIMVTTIGVFGPLVTAHLVYPYYSLARYISLAKILERMELYLVIFWIAGVIVKLAVFLHSSCIAAASTLNLKNYRLTIIPVALITIALCEVLYSSDYLRLIIFFKQVWPFYGCTIELIIPSLILLIAVILGKGKKSGEGTK
ncbi:MAG: endospore germination permease [Firmicutes bacterium]|nr:endospore germination permease [Bacillota bacterium]